MITTVISWFLRSRKGIGMQNSYSIIKKKFELKRFLILSLFLMALSWSFAGFGQSTAVYNVATVSSVTTTGTGPSGASATYSQTYTTAKQITSGKNAILTLNGYAGYKITSIVLNMKSNTSAGAGTLSVVAGSTTIASVPTAAAFNTSSWNGAWSTSYVNVTKTPTAYAIQTGESVVITIAATANSLYIQSYSITYEPVASTFAVTYNGNGNTGGAVPTDVTSYSSGATVTVLGNTGSLVKTGYTFAGWNTAADGSGTSYTTGSTFSIAANTTLYSKWLSSDATLASLTLSSGTLSPAFASATTLYSASVANATSSVTVTPTFTQSNAAIQVRVNGGSYTSVASGTASGSLALNVGDNTIDVLVTAQDGTTKTYTVTLNRASASTPVITIGTITGFGDQCINTASSEKSYNISGANLTADIVVTAPIGYQISTTSGSGFGSSVTLTQIAGAVSSTPIYVRFIPTLAQAYSGSIAHSSTGATQQDLALSGTGTSPVDPSVNIAVTSGANPTCPGTSVTFTATPTNGGTPSYQWKKDGNNVCTNSATYTDDGSVAGSITCIMTTSLTCVNTATATSSAIALAQSVANVASPAATAGNAQVSVGWTNPSCYDEILIVAATATNSGIPTGDGTSYTANLGYTGGTALGNGYVAYKGTSSPEIITGLTNGTNYYFKLFTRKGTVWSAGVEVSATPVAGPCVTEGFESGLSTSGYVTSGGSKTLGSGNWTFESSGLRNSTYKKTGSYSCQIKNGSSYYASTPVLTNCASVSFWFYGSTAPTVKYGTTTYSTVALTSNGSSAFNQFSATINSSSSEKVYFYNTSGSTGYLDDVGIYCITGPTITVTTLTDFGSVCTNTNSAEQTYNVSGTNLTADITIVPPTGYEISTGTGGSFVPTNPITLTQTAGTVTSTPIYVRFNPTLIQSYSGNITHSSTGATEKNVAVSGSGVNNSAPAIATPTSASVTSATATLGGNITSTGCANVTERGIYWSTISGFANGAGTKVSEISGSYSTGTFTINVSGLTSATDYYYKAFATSANGTVYTAEGAFTTACATALLPITEGFENSGSIPTCWSSPTVADSDADAIFTYLTSGTYPTVSPEEGSYLLKFNSYSCDSGDEKRLISKPFSTTGYSGINVKFAWYNDNGYSSDLLEGVTVQWSLDGITWSNSTFYQRYKATTGWTNQTCVLPAGVDNQSTVYVGFLFHSQNGNNCYLDDIVISTVKSEPANHVTAFTCGATAPYNIPLSWIDATGTTIPDGYLIKWSGAGYDDITDPADGTPVADGAGAINIPSGVQFANIGSLSASTTYYFKIYPYTNTGSNINYKIDGTIPATSCTTLETPCLTESFESATFPPTDWINNSTIRTENGGACDGSYQLGFNASGDYIITKAIDNPKTMIFNYKRSATDGDWSLKIQKSNSVSGPWTDVQTITDATESCQIANIDLTAYAWETGVYFKLLDTRSSGTLERYIDNFNIVCNACSAPSIPSSAISFSSIIGAGMNLNWTQGNGSSRIIIARAFDAVTFVPSNLTTYAANSTFGAGTDLGSGQFCIYNGSGSTVNITGLSANTLYHFAVYDYNCTTGNEMYNTTPLTASQGTTDYISASTITGSPFCVSNTNSASIDVPFVYQNSATFANGTAVFTAQLSDPSGNFNNSIEIGTIISNGSGLQTINAVIPAGTVSGTNYKIRVNSTAPSITGSAIQVPIIINNSPDNVTINAPLEETTQVSISWNAPIGCYDDYMVVVSTSSVAAIPTGDGSAYTAVAAYGSGTSFGGGYVVQKGTSTSIAITELADGTTYYARIYTRWGTDWSSGSEIIISPNTSTILNYGDLAILSVNTNQTGGDEISFVPFKSISTNTTIDFTDNGYEYRTAGTWNMSEGTLRLTRTGSTLPAGTVVTFVGTSNDATPEFGADFNVFANGVNDNANWSISSLNGAGPFDLNVNDQIWIMQHGTWVAGTDHDATYSGSILYGWTATGWKTAPGYVNTKGSTIPGSAVCAVTNVAGKAHEDKVKYTGPTSPASKVEWIGRVNEPSNWTDYADNSSFDNGVPKYKTVGATLSVLSGNLDVSGKWAGYHTTSWCNCANWKSLTVPTATDNVEIPANYTRNVELSDNADSLAVCKNLIVHGGTIFGKDSRGKKITVNGDLIINGGTLDFGGASDADGQIVVNGNFIDSTGGAGFIPGKSLVTFAGGTNQSLKMINGTGQSFYHLEINKSGGTVNMFNDLQVTDSLTFSAGEINAGTYIVTLGQSTTNKGILMHTSGYVNGKFRRWLNGINMGNQSGLFPVGTAFHYCPIKIEYTSAPTAGGYLTANFVSSPMGIAGMSILAANSGGFGMDIEQTSNDGYWKVDNQSGTLTDGEYKFTATLNGAQGISDVSKLTLVKRVGGGDWFAPGTHVASSGTTTAPTVSRTGLTGYSNFGLGSGSGNALPIELISFNADCNNIEIGIQWKTASETNNSHFIIERSNDGIFWERIGQVAGAGNSSMAINYKYIDKFTGDNHYYRLVQVDFNGESVIYGPIATNCQNLNGAEVSVNPNPFNDFLTIRISGEEQQFTVSVSDVAGKLILENQMVATGAFDLNTSGFAPGVYVLKIVSNGTCQAFKVVKR